MLTGSFSASRFVFPHAPDDAVGEVSLVGPSCFASRLALAEFAVDVAASVVVIAVLGDAGHVLNATLAEDDSVGKVHDQHGVPVALSDEVALGTAVEQPGTADLSRNAAERIDVASVVDGPRLVGSVTRGRRAVLGRDPELVGGRLQGRDGTSLSDRVRVGASCSPARRADAVDAGLRFPDSPTPRWIAPEAGNFGRTPAERERALVRPP